MKLAIHNFRFSIAATLCALTLKSAVAGTILFTDGVIHTAANGIIAKGAVLVQSNKITGVYDLSKHDLKLTVPSDAVFVKLHGQHLYPGMFALDSALGLTEIDALRSTSDQNEVGDFTPDVQSWIAVNPDSELLPVARANGIAYFEPVPYGKIVSGQSGLLAIYGWTWEQMLVRKPVALHLFWPGFELDTTPKSRLADPSKAKSLEGQDKERRQKVADIQDFFDDARAYAKSRASHPLDVVPAWEDMLTLLRGEVPLVIHANEFRQIKSAINWAVANHFKTVLYGGRDAWMLADLLASNNIPVVYEAVFALPTRDTEQTDVHFTAPEVLRKAGVKVSFSTGPGGFGATMVRNLPYNAAQAVAFGFPEEEADKSLTLYPAQILGVADHLGSIEAGKTATLFICDGSILDIRANVKRMWIDGHEVSLQSRHTRLYEKYKNRPAPQ